MPEWAKLITRILLRRGVVVRRADEGQGVIVEEGVRVCGARSWGVQAAPRHRERGGKYLL